LTRPGASFRPTWPHVVVFEGNSVGWSSLKSLKITSKDAPLSAAIAAQREAKPKKVKSTKLTFIESERAMFSLALRTLDRLFEKG
jgi:hypothetical protein